MLVAVQDQTGENWKHGSSLKQVRSASLRPDRADILANVFNDAECRFFMGVSLSIIYRHPAPHKESVDDLEKEESYRQLKSRNTA